MTNTKSRKPLPEIEALHEAGVGTMLITPDVAPNGVFMKVDRSGRPWRNADGVRATSWGVYRLGYRAPSSELITA